MKTKESEASGIHDRVIKQAYRKMKDLAALLDEHNLVLFCGGCNDYAQLLHRDTGIELAYEKTDVWMGGDGYNEIIDGMTINVDASAAAKKFADTLKGQKNDASSLLYS